MHFKNRASKTALKHLKPYKTSQICNKTNSVNYNFQYIIVFDIQTYEIIQETMYQHGPLKYIIVKSVLIQLKKMESKSQTNGWIAAVLCFLITLGSFWCKSIYSCNSFCIYCIYGCIILNVWTSFK